MRTLSFLVFAGICPAVSVDLAQLLLRSPNSEILGVAHDAAGNIYLGGHLRFEEFPTVRPLQSEGGLFLIKLSPAGEVLLATPLGTLQAWDSFGGLAVDRSGTVWIAGSTRLPNLAITPGGSPRNGDADVFLIAVPSTLDRISVATYYGGTGYEVPHSIASDADGNVWVGGFTGSTDLPLTPGALRWNAEAADGFLARFRPDGTLAYSTRVGASGWDQVAGVRIAEDGAPILLVNTGSADFPGVVSFGVPTLGSCVVKLRPDASAFQYSFCLPPNTHGRGVAAAGGRVWVAGTTYSIDLPVTSDAFQKRTGARPYSRLDAPADGPPANVVRKLLMVGHKMYATTDRGVFVSENAGEIWRSINTGLSSLDTGAIAVSPSDPSRMYLALETGNQIYRSRDAGESWEPVGEWPRDVAIRALTVDPHDGRRIFAGGTGMFLSTDGGETWTKQEWPTQAIVAQIAVDPADANIVYAGTPLFSPMRFIREGGVFRSRDGGRTFFATSIRNTDASQVLADPFHPGVVYAAGTQGFSRSSDYGETWTTSSSVQQGYPYGFRGLTLDRGTVYAVVGEGLVYRTMDGGDSFEPLSVTKRYAIANTIAVSADGRVHTGGAIGSDAFLVRLNGTTGEREYATYFAGAATEEVSSIAADAAGNVVIAGHTWSADLPELDAAAPPYRGPLAGFVAGFRPDGSLWFSTNTGGHSYVTAVSLSSSQRVHAAGITSGTDFPFDSVFIEPAPQSGFILRMQ